MLDFYFGGRVMVNICGNLIFIDFNELCNIVYVYIVYIFIISSLYLVDELIENCCFFN